MSDLNPITRREVFLAAAGGQQVETPEPITREEKFLKAIAENAGGGSDLPDDPAQDGTYNLQNTVSSGTGTLSWASGGSSGGVLVVTQDENGVLNKTWQEIHDGMPAVIIADDGDDRYAYCVQSVTKAPDGTSFIVTVGAMSDNTAYTDNYAASSASGYPTLVG